MAELFVTVGADITGFTSGLQNVSTQLRNVGSSISSVGADLSKGITAPIVGVGAIITKLGADFEHSMTEVRKSTGLAGPELENFQKGILALSVDPLSGGRTAEQLAQIAAVAGQLGIANDDLLGFTKTASRLSAATNIDPGTLAEALGQISKVAHVPIGEMENLGSAITALGNDMGGTEADILEFTRRLAGSLTVVGVLPANILAISSALAEVGVNPEAGATAIQKFFLEMTAAATGTSQATEEQAKKMQNLRDRITDLGSSLQAAQTRMQSFGRNTPAAEVQKTTADIEKYKRELGQAQAEMGSLQKSISGGNVEAFAKVAGVTADEFKKMVANDPTDAFTAIIDGLGRIKAEQGKGAAIAALGDIGIVDSRQVQAMLSLAEGAASLHKAIGISNSAWKENTALSAEVAARAQDTENKFQLLQNELKKIAIEAWPAFKSAAADAMNFVHTEVITRLQQLLAAWQALSPEMQRSILVFAAFAAAIGPAVFIIGLIVSAIGALLSPIGLAVAAVALLAAAWITNFGDIQGKTQAFIDLATSKFQEIAGIIGGLLGPAFERLKGIFEAVRPTLTAWASFVGQIVILFVTLFDRAVREVANFFDTILRPALQSFGAWMLQFVITPLIAMLKFIGDVLAATGLGSALGGLDIPGAIRAAEAAVAQTSAGVAAGGPGKANDIVVNINNPTIPDQTVGDRFAAQVQNAIIDAMIGAERTVPLPQPLPGAVPGSPF